MPLGNDDALCQYDFLLMVDCLVRTGCQRLRRMISVGMAGGKMNGRRMGIVMRVFVRNTVSDREAWVGIRCGRKIRGRPMELSCDLF
jgi:hypothetical protein